MTNDLVRLEVRGTYQAYINLFYGLGSAMGATFGGFLCDRLGWRLTFVVQLPPLVLVALNAALTTPKSLGPQLGRHSNKTLLDAVRSFDVAGSLLLTVSVAGLILGLDLGGNVYAWTHPLVLASLAVAVVAAAALVRVEARSELPVMPIKMLSSRPRANLVFHNFFANVAAHTILFNAPLYFQAVQLDSPSVSGFRLAAFSVALTACGVSSGFVMAATGRMKELVVGGALALLAGAVCLAALWDGAPTWLASVFLVPTSVGLGLSFPAVSVAVLATSTQADQAVMTSTLALWRSLGIVVGVSLSSLVVQNALAVYLRRLVTGDHQAEVRVLRLLTLR